MTLFQLLCLVVWVAILFSFIADVVAWIEKEQSYSFHPPSPCKILYDALYGILSLKDTLKATRFSLVFLIVATAIARGRLIVNFSITELLVGVWPGMPVEIISKVLVCSMYLGGGSCIVITLVLLVVARYKRYYGDQMFAENAINLLWAVVLILSIFAGFRAACVIAGMTICLIVAAPMGLLIIALPVKLLRCYLAGMSLPTWRFFKSKKRS